MAGYHGWKNYETWLVFLWISTDRGLLSAVEDMVADICPCTKDDRDDCIPKLSDRLRDFIVEDVSSVHQLDGMDGNLLTSAYDEVSWGEIAEAMCE